jgi:dienelactone hydrolase
MSKLFIFAFVATAALASCNGNDSKTTQNSADSANQNAQKGGLKEENISFTADTVNLNGFLAYNESTDKRPAVIVVPEWWGLNDYAKGRAKQLADLGYVALAIDMYGNGKQADNPDDAGKLAGPFYMNPKLGESRIDAAIAKLKTYPQVDTSKIAAIGYCFGGSMVLNAARAGSDLDGVVSFHGVLTTNPAPDKSKMKAQILVCHGGADKFTPAKDSITFRKQLDEAGVVYDFKTYPNSKHAFTNPKADENAQKFKGLDVAYNAEADKQSWEDMKAFLSRVFK